METRQLLEEIKRRLKCVYETRLQGVILYGSQARGEETPESDIDVLVLLKAPIDFGRDLQRNLDALYPLSLELNRRISAKPVSAHDYETVDCPLFQRVRKEGVAA